MRWNELFADLEAQLQFGQWQAVEQDAAELTRGLWAEIRLIDRLRGALGQQVRLMLADGRVLICRLEVVGPSWIGGIGETAALLVTREAILAVDADLQRATIPRKPLQAGPSMVAIYRMLARRREPVQILARNGQLLAEGTIDRVGADHVDVALHARDEFRRGAALRGMRTIPFDAIQMLQASPMGLSEA